MVVQGNRSDKGTVIGRKYVLTGNKLGTGAFGVVLKAKSQATGQHVAAKFLIHTNESELSKINKEVQLQLNAQRSINGVEPPNVLKLIEVLDDVKFQKGSQQHNAKVLIMELARPNNMFDILSNFGPLTEVVARTYFLQLIDTLEVLHKRGIVHRDLKCENLMLGDNFELKLGDFGEGKEMSFEGDGLTHTAGVGSAYYRAPELLADASGKSKGYDPRVSDMWSCGVLLFCLVSGQAPFTEAEDPAYSDANQYDFASFWESHTMSQYEACTDGRRYSSFSANCKHLINQLLVVDPKRRPSIESVKSHPWLKNAQSLGRHQLFLKMKYLTSKTPNEMRDVAVTEEENIDAYHHHRAVSEETEVHSESDEDDEELAALNRSLHAMAMADAKAKGPTSTQAEEKTEAENAVEEGEENYDSDSDVDETYPEVDDECAAYANPDSDLERNAYENSDDDDIEENYPELDDDANADFDIEENDSDVTEKAPIFDGGFTPVSSFETAAPLSEIRRDLSSIFTRYSRVDKSDAFSWFVEESKTCSLYVNFYSKSSESDTVLVEFERESGSNKDFWDVFTDVRQQVQLA